VTILLFILILFVILFGVILMAIGNDILSKLSEANTHLDALIAQGANSIPPTEATMILGAATALDEKIVAAIQPVP
jgi:hypothetical protein